MSDDKETCPACHCLERGVVVPVMVYVPYINERGAIASHGSAPIPLICCHPFHDQEARHG